MRVRAEMDSVIAELEKRGVDMKSHQSTDIQGLGDVVEEVLTMFGITEERFKKWFDLKECNCTTRKKWLNNLFSWRVKKTT